MCRFALHRKACLHETSMFYTPFRSMLRGNCEIWLMIAPTLSAVSFKIILREQ